MKPKKLQKPLGLNKQTIANFELSDLSKVQAKGGACTYPGTGCNTVINPVCCSINPNTCTMPGFCNTYTQPGCTCYTLAVGNECV
jgi:hypothetical protein